jgi:putative spermidine/putrescine transport system permease protein
MAKVASRRTKAALVIAVLIPLWSGYLVKVLSWRTMLSPSGGFISWVLEPFGLSSPGYGNTAVWLVMSYLWLPYMVLPIFAGLERIPNTLISASEDLGAKPFTTFRRVILPLTFPAVVAGSIFTFALTLGDYITPRLVSNNQFIGNVIFNNISNNLPLASALALVPIVVMVGYLLVARRLGAFEHI